jgi:endonuclease-3
MEFCMNRSPSTLDADRSRAIAIIHQLRIATVGMPEPAAGQIVRQFGRNPFLVLISCLLSLRTKDTVSLPASLRLFEQATTPEQILAIPRSSLEKIIYPVGFYRVKAANIGLVCRQLLEQFGGDVPETEEALLSLPGVGRKTANLVLGEGFGIPALCVDTHVHRISNRLGLVATTTPAQTEMALRELLPPEYWIEYNSLLVMWGQNICVPISPFCSSCAIAPLCPKVGVGRRR